MNPLATKIWEVTLIDAGDGSGDAILNFPDELMALLEWAENDILALEVGENCIRVSKKNSNVE